MKNIMLITFLLLAVLTIGAASAADDVASDDLADSGDIEVIADVGDPNEDGGDGDDGDGTDEGDDTGDEDYGYYSIKVNDVSLEDESEFDKNFTEVTVDDKDQTFAIYAYNDEEDDLLLFKEDLNNRAYEEIEDEGSTLYKFGFTFNDMNNYIANFDDATGFDDLISQGLIENHHELYFTFEDEEGSEYYSQTWIISINPDAYVFNRDDEEEEEDIGEYGDLDVIMYDDGEWKNDVVIDFKVEKGTDATIIIYLNDNETAAFQKKLSELQYVEDEEDKNIVHYNVTVGNLNIEKAGEYVLRIYLQDEEDKNIWQYDDEEPETLTLYEAQVAENENARIEATPITTTISDEPIIEINTENNESNVVIYVDDDETPITKQLKEFKQDEYGTYLITANDLNLGPGEHDLNITYMGANLIATVDLISAVEIELAEPDEVIITGDDFDDYFVTIGLNEEDIHESDIDGKINVTVYDEEENAVATLEKDITSLSYHDGPRAYVVRVSDMASNLNGTYLVTVKYFDGNQASTEESGKVQFKLFDPADYGTTIKNTITDEEDYVITFTELPPADNVIVKIDGIETEIEEMELFDNFDEEEGVYSIKIDRLNGLDEGTHSVVVGIDVNDVFKELAKGNVIVDLEENYDLALTITVANIEEGGVATVVITTNSTFTGAIAVQIGANNYSVNVVNGQGSAPVADLKANTYTATALFKSDGIFTDATKAATFTVTAKPAAPSTPSTPTTPAAPAKKVIKLTLKKVKVKKSAKKLVLKATLKINGKAPKKGTKIKFTFKGKKYIGKTNKKGVAKVIIKKKVLKKLKVGKKVKYTAKYSTKTVKRTAKVKR